MSFHRTRSRRRGLGPRVALGVVGVCVVLASVWALRSGLGGPNGARAGAANAGGACVEVHAGHALMMWSPVMADEMADAGCAWPYQGFAVDLGGGADDPVLDAPFVARRYGDLRNMIFDAGYGTCSFGADTAAGVPGRAFQFTYSVSPGGCFDGAATGLVVVAEWGTEAQRDRAAVERLPGETNVVLGRWTIRLSGSALGLAPEFERVGGQLIRS